MSHTPDRRTFLTQLSAVGAALGVSGATVQGAHGEPVLTATALTVFATLTPEHQALAIDLLYMMSPQYRAERARRRRDDDAPAHPRELYTDEQWAGERLLSTNRGANRASAAGGRR
jgi:hypothetical protein